MASEKPAKREIPRAYQTGRRSSSYSSGSYRSSSGKDGSDRATDTGWPWDHYCVMAARVLVLISLVYAAWRFGATDSAGHFHLSILLGVAAILTLTARRSFTRKSRRLPVFVFTLGLLWIGYAAMQSMPIVAPFGFAFPGHSSIQHQITSPATSRLETAIKQLDESNPAIGYGIHASVSAYQTQQATVPLVLAFTIMVLSVVLFESRQSRTAYLWVLVVHSALLAAWGIIQRAGGDSFILPGIENTYSTIPFASFIYKNAGAAALLPGFAAIAALLYGYRSKDQNESPTNNFSKPLFLLQPKNLTLCAITGLLTAGLLASLSRGAWVSAVIAAVIAFTASRIKVSKTQLAVLTVSLFALTASVIALTGIRHKVSYRANQVTVTNFSDNQRWEHWKDGLVSAWFYTPAGSGVGTYGYASLPSQSGPRGFWFREAHNQYLEVLTESGVIGFVLLCAGMSWFGVTTWRLLRQDEHREKSSWGLLGLIVLVCGASQSVVDFVLKIPANMLLYASLIGIVAGTERSYMAYLRSHPSKRSVTVGETKDPVRKTELQYTMYRMPAIWCLICVGLVAYGGFLAFWNSCADATLETIRASHVAGLPSVESVKMNLSRLDQAISHQPHRADLFRQRADWRFNQYRLRLVETAEASGNPVGWEDTRLESIESTIASLDKPSRQQLIDELLATPELRNLVARVLGDLSRSLQRNPLDPATHLKCLLLSPLTGMPVEPWIKSTAKLNMNSAEMLFWTGVVAYQHELHDLAIDQWSKSIASDEKHLEEIYTLSRQKLTPEQMARQVIPPHRTDLLLRLVRDADKESPMLAEEVGDELIKYLNAQSVIEPAATEAALGGIYQALGDKEQAVQHWEQATILDPKEPVYRLRFAVSLRRIGDYEKALQQSILGGTLDPNDERLTDMTLRIRQDISRQRNFD